MKGYKEETLAELVCELTRNCGLKEDYFASSFNLSPAQVRILKLYSYQFILHKGTMRNPQTLEWQDNTNNYNT